MIAYNFDFFATFLFLSEQQFQSSSFSVVSFFPHSSFVWLFMFILFTITDPCFLIFIFLEFNFHLPGQRQKYFFHFDPVFFCWFFVSFQVSSTSRWTNSIHWPMYLQNYHSFQFHVPSPTTQSSLRCTKSRRDFFFLILCVNQFNSVFVLHLCLLSILKKKTAKRHSFTYFIQFHFVESVNWKQFLCVVFPQPHLCIFWNPKQFSRGYFIVVQLFYKFFFVFHRNSELKKNYEISSPSSSYSRI